MKRLMTLFVAAALAAAGLPAFAQTGGWSWEAGVSPGLMDRHYGFSEIRDRQYSATYTKDSHTVSYQSHPMVLPTLSLQGGYVIPDTSLGVFLGVYGSYASNDLYGGPSPLQEREIILHVLPELRFYYLNDPGFKLYGTLGTGVRYRQYSETFEGDTVGKRDFRLSYEVSPVGLSVGERWFVSLDFGWGFPWAICKFSGGCRF